MNKRLIKFKEFKLLVLNMCSTIQRTGWKPDYIVGISRGGLLPAVMISQYFNIPMKPLQVSLRDNIETVSDLGMAEDAYNNKNILIVDDINDQGTTLNWIMKDWPSGCFPDDPKWEGVWGNNVRFAVVVDNLSSKCNVGMDYWGMEVNKAEKDVWIEFPYEEWWVK
jgi:hypoxanthine-guanine phosphoribosyltransferase